MAHRSRHHSSSTSTFKSNSASQISQKFLNAIRAPEGRYFYYTSQSYRQYNAYRIPDSTDYFDKFSNTLSSRRAAQSAKDDTIEDLINFLTTKFGKSNSEKFAKEIDTLIDNALSSEDMQKKINALPEQTRSSQVGAMRGNLAEPILQEFAQNTIAPLFAKQFPTSTISKVDVTGSGTSNLITPYITKQGKEQITRTRLSDLELTITTKQTSTKLNISIKWFTGKRNPRQSLGQIQPNEVYQSSLGEIEQAGLFSFANILHIYDNGVLRPEFDAFQVYFVSRLIPQIMFGQSSNDLADMFITKSGFASAAQVFADVRANIKEFHWAPNAVLKLLSDFRGDDKPNRATGAEQRRKRTEESWNNFMKSGGWHLFRK